MFIAHRGKDSHKYPENSTKGLLWCLQKDYIDGVELDVRLTKDNKIVLIHNMSIDAVSDGEGFVSFKTLKELKKYNFGKKGYFLPISTLEEFLSQVDSSKIIMIDIKEETGSYDKWVKAFKKIYIKYAYLSLYICSFNYKLITILQKKYPKFKFGIIIGYLMNINKDISTMDFVSYHYKNFKYSHLTTFVWTMNQKELALQFKNKVNYIITDKAYLLK